MALSLCNINSALFALSVLEDRVYVYVCVIEGSRETLRLNQHCMEMLGFVDDRKDLCFTRLGRDSS